MFIPVQLVYWSFFLAVQDGYCWVSTIMGFLVLVSCIYSDLLGVTGSVCFALNWSLLIVLVVRSYWVVNYFSSWRGFAWPFVLRFLGSDIVSTEILIWVFSQIKVVRILFVKNCCCMKLSKLCFSGTQGTYDDPVDEIPGNWWVYGFIDTW